MASLKEFVIANALSVWMAGQMTVWMTGATQIESFEKQALSSVQEMSASYLDAELSDRPFAIWLSQIIGPNAGVVWQLTECGERIVASRETGHDLPACAEVNAKLPDGRRVFVAISVGTFKKGLNGKPVFYSAVIEQNERLYPVRRLRDLPEMLRAPDSLSDKDPATNTRKRIVNPPMIQAAPARILTPIQDTYLSPPPSNFLPTADYLSQPPPPPASPTPTPLPQEPVKVSESDLQSRVITRVKPVYPPSAKKMNATGPVEVEITISGEGLVVEAKAISGHIALRSAAVEAARKWVFKPATFKGANIRTKGVLTFMFAPSSMD
ncbi:MAG TPA: energy transducer TonB [Blastocatellia bacterium]|nr:energy transducer TonB [Blastocatellia bacterium]